jgi:hypothetical protein
MISALKPTLVSSLHSCGCAEVGGKVKGHPHGTVMARIVLLRQPGSHTWCGTLNL